MDHIEGNVKDAIEILDHLNKIHKNIRFTIEIEMECQINYLDITISRENNIFKFETFRKLRQTYHTNSLLIRTNT